MSETNLERFYYDKFDRAVQLFEDKQTARAADICCELGEEFLCPRLVQVQALQLRSNCTEDYWPAQEYLEKALKLLENLEDNSDELVRTYRIHTKKMIRSNEAIWQEHWRKQGRDPPSQSTTAQGLEDDSNVAKIDEGKDKHKAVETAWRQLGSMTLGDGSELPVPEIDDDDQMLDAVKETSEQPDQREWVFGGGSSPVEGMPGGATRPWERDPPGENAPTGLLSPFSDLDPDLLMPPKEKK